MTLSISPRLTDIQFQNTPLVYFTKENLLSVAQPNSVEDCITDLDKIVSIVNKLNKPIFKEIDAFFRIYQRLERINLVLKGEKFDLVSFAKHLQPNAKELKDRIWAIHSSRYLWPDGIMRPIIRQFRGKSKEEVSGGISGTIHFSLGGKVKPHHVLTSWEDDPYALMTKLGNISDQLINLYPYDTSILNSWKIAKGSILIVPSSTNVPNVYKENGCEIVYYDPTKTTVRKVVKNKIQENDGIILKMVKHLIRFGTPAYLFGEKQINVNTPDFFSSILEKGINYGYEAATVSGSGYCTAIIRQMPTLVKKLAQDNPTLPLIKICYAYVLHAFEKIGDSLDQSTRKELEKFLDLYQDLFSDIRSEDKFTISGDILSNLNSEELESFKAKFPQFFIRYNRYEFEATWALIRWLNFGDELATRENLKDIFRENLTRIIDDIPCTYDILGELSNYLESESERANIVLNVLNLDETKQFNRALRKKLKDLGTDNMTVNASSGSLEPSTLVTFNDPYDIHTIADALKQHSLAGKAVTGVKSQLRSIKTILGGTFESREKDAVSILLKICPIKCERNLDVLTASYSKLLHAWSFLPNQRYLKEIISTPMRQLEYGAAQLFLTWCKLYFPEASILWRRLGLEESYKNKFLTNEDFWNSDKTFIQIYYDLKDANPA